MQPLLPTFEHSDNDLIELALSMPYEQKVEKAIKLLQTMEPIALKANPEIGFDLGFSGGKDSCASDGLLKMAGVKYTGFYNETTIDPPPLIDFIRKHHPDVIWNTPRDKYGHLILDRMVEKRSMPTRMGKWCCSEYKECCGQLDTVGVVGVRIEESARRAGLWKEVHKHTETGRTIIAPICYWTDEDVWRFIKENDIPYCELYDQGWDRLGCVGCPINPASQEKEFQRWPEFEAMWKEGCKRIWEISQTEKNTRGEWRYWKKFKRWEDMWEWWINAKLPDYLNDDKLNQLTMELKNYQAGCSYDDMMENT